jgi:hypothetical protein
MMGIPTRDERRAATVAAEAERRLAREAARLEREAARAAAAEERRQRRLEYNREYSRRYRAADPQRKREQDQRYVAAHKDAVRAGKAMRSARAKARGYKWNPTAQYLAKRKATEDAITAAVAYLRSVGLFEWWGSKETTEARRNAAYAYVRDQGLL